MKNFAIIFTILFFSIPFSFADSGDNQEININGQQEEYAENSSDDSNEPSSVSDVNKKETLSEEECSE